MVVRAAPRAGACHQPWAPSDGCSNRAAPAVPRRYEADWKIVERGWAAHVLGEAPNTFTDAVTAIKTLRVRPRRATAAPQACTAAAWGGGAKRAKRSGRAYAHRSGLGTLAPRASAPYPPALCQPFSPPGWPRAQKDGSDSPVSDQWLPPFVIVDDAGKPVGTVEDGARLGTALAASRQAAAPRGLALPAGCAWAPARPPQRPSPAVLPFGPLTCPPCPPSYEATTAPHHQPTKTPNPTQATPSSSSTSAPTA